jgi:hypothetical protein
MPEKAKLMPEKAKLMPEKAKLMPEKAKSMPRMSFNAIKKRMSEKIRTCKELLELSNGKKTNLNPDTPLRS